MSDAKNAGNDPSMDDILASIRKIISDDEARAQVGGPPGPQASAPRPVPSTVIPMAPPPQAEARPASIMMRTQPSASAGGRTAPASRDDVLLLTDLIEEPKLGAAGPRPTVVPPAPVPQIPMTPVQMAPVQMAPPPMPLPRVEAVPQPSVTQTVALQRINPVRAREMSPPADPAPDQPLVAKNVAGATNSALERLSQAVQESVPMPTAPNPGPPVGSSGKTIEDMVKEMLRPMLKEWLDKNLPPMVERFVEREIVRLTRR